MKAVNKSLWGDLVKIRQRWIPKDNGGLTSRMILKKSRPSTIAPKNPSETTCSQPMLSCKLPDVSRRFFLEATANAMPHTIEMEGEWTSLLRSEVEPGLIRTERDIPEKWEEHRRPPQQVTAFSCCGLKPASSVQNSHFRIEFPSKWFKNVAPLEKWLRSLVILENSPRKLIHLM